MVDIFLRVPDQVILDDLPTLAAGMGNGGFMIYIYYIYII